jgi:ABC-type nitrate/sulfonate/bicarbonate transport system permease component
MTPSLRRSARLFQVGFVLLLVAAWYWGNRLSLVHPMLLPPLGSVVTQFAEIVAQGAFWPDLRVTMYEHVSAFSLATVAGLLVGFTVSFTRFSVRVFDPLLAGMYSIPAVLLFPLFVLVFGIGPGSKIALGATIAFFPIALNTIAAFSTVDRAYVRAAHSMGASSQQMFWQVMLPAGFPIVLSGLRIGMITSFLSILGAETIASLDGLGHRIVAYVEIMESDKMFAFILIALIVAFVLNGIASAVDSWGRRNFT